MKIKDLIPFVDARLLCGENLLETEVSAAFASDLMSDVLTLSAENVLLITGLCNIQTLRTVEMADLRVILFVRGKMPTPEMMELAKENDLVILTTSYSMFKTSGLLFQVGMPAVY